MAEVKLVIKQVDQGSQGISQLGDSYDALKGTISKVGAAIGTVAAAVVTAKKVFDFSQEGANLNQLTESFDYMNESVYKTPGLLDDMSDAVRGTIKETDLMKSLLTLTAGASNDAAQAYADAAPKLLEIAKASNKLNPALGDTAFLFDSLALGIKRGSPMILDNLGLTIKVGEANEQYAASLGKSVEALTAEEKTMALLNATISAGDQLINQVGGNVDSQADAWAQLTVNLGEAADGYKQVLAESQVVTGAIGYLNKDLNLRDQLLESSAALEEFGYSGVALQKALGALGEGTILWRDSLVDADVMARRTDIAIQLLEGGFKGGANELAALVMEQETAILRSQEMSEFYAEQNIVVDYAAIAISAAAQAIRDQTQAAAAAAGPNEELADKITQANNRLSEQEAFVAAANANMHNMAGATDVATGAIADQVNELSNLQQLLGSLPSEVSTDVDLRVYGIDTLERAQALLNSLQNPMGPGADPYGGFTPGETASSQTPAAPDPYANLGNSVDDSILPSSGGGVSGALAAGGPAYRGNLYQVGEGNQPEILQQNGKLYLIPGDQGRVTPTSQAGGLGGTQVVNNFNITQRAGESGPAFANRLSTMVAEKLGNLK